MKEVNIYTPKNGIIRPCRRIEDYTFTRYWKAKLKWLFAFSCLVATLAFSSSAVLAQTGTWTGAGDGISWDLAANWAFAAGGSLVNPATRYTIPAGPPGPIITAGGLVMEQLTINPMASAAWPFGFTLTISNPGAGDGLHNDGAFSNGGVINILMAGGDGINNTGLFANTDAIITINNTGDDGIDNSGSGLGAGFFNNAFMGNSTIAIGPNIGSDGIENSGDFLNMGFTFGFSALIDIDGFGGVFVGAGIFNEPLTGNFTNGGGATFGASDIEIDDVGGNGIDNDGTFLSAGGAGLPFTGTALIEIGITGAIPGNGINNSGDFDNQSNSTIDIDPTEDGINNNGATATFDNTGLFPNTALINIDDADSDGIENTGGASFNNNNNASVIDIGSTVKPGFHGVNNNGGSTFRNLDGALLNIDGSGRLGLGHGILNDGAGTTFTNGDIFAATVEIDNTMNLGDGVHNSGGSSFTNQVSGSMLTIGATGGPGNISDDGLAVLGGSSFFGFPGSLTSIDNTTGDGLEVGDGVNGGLVVIDDSVLDIIGVGASSINNLFDGNIQSTGSDNDPILSVVNVLSGGGACDGTHPISNAGAIVAGNCSVWNVDVKVDNTPGGVILVDDAYWFQECGGAIAAMTTPANFINNGVVFDPNKHFVFGILLQNNDLVVDIKNTVQASICDNTVVDILMNEVDAPQDGQAEETWYSDPARTMPVGTYNNLTNTYTPNVLPLLAGNHTFYFNVHKNAALGVPLDACESFLGKVTLNVGVLDVQPPTVATCPMNIVQANDAGLCSAVVSYAAPTFNDNCDGLGLAGTLTGGLASGSAFPVGTTIVKYEYTDAAGNGPAVCSFTVTVNDTEPPTMACPLPAFAQCSADEVPVYDNSVEFLAAGGILSDNCEVNYGTFGMASEIQVFNIVTRIYIVMDIHGNAGFCQHTITIMDNTDPEILLCPENITVNNDVDKCGANVNWQGPEFTDNCGSIQAIAQNSGLPSGSFFPVGTTTVEFEAFDGAFNSVICSFTVTVNDMQYPHIHVCPADRDINTNPGVCEGTVPDMTGEVEFIENCPGAVVTQSPVAGSTFGANPGDMVVVTFTVTDTSGNTNAMPCTNKLTLVDNEPPVAVCQDITIGLDVFGNASVTAADIDGGSTDNCGIASLEITSGQTTYDCDDVGNTFTLTLKVTDTSGNTDTCTAEVTVVEGAATCNPIISINDPCVCSVIPGYFDELVTVNALAGQTWTVVAISGLFSSPGNPITVGTTLTENPLGVFTLAGIHQGDVGYSITVENEFGEQLSAATTCYLPELFIAGVDDFSNECTDPFTITAGEANAISADAGLLEVTGPPGGIVYASDDTEPFSVSLTPSDLIAGIYTVCFTFDAGVATPDNPLDPGCVVTICETFEIIDPVQVMTCNNLVNVSIDDVCCVEITPDMVLEGNHGPDGAFEVEITDFIGTPLNPPNIVCADHIGMNLIVTVTEPCSGLSCWGGLNIEDKLAPQMECPPDLTLYCNQDTDPLFTGYPVVEDCSDWTLDFTDEEEFFGNCEDIIRVIVRTFVAIDIHGNQNECTQTIIVKKPTLDDIQFPKDVQWTCDNYNAFPNVIDPTALHPFVGDSDPATPNFCEVFLNENCDDDDGNLVGFCGIPFPGTFNDTKDRDDTNSTNLINGGLGCPGEVCGNNGLDDADVLELTGSGIPVLGGAPFQGVGACMLSILHSDEWFEICTGSFEILRTWKVRDMCLPVSADNPRVHVQVIKVLDIKPPALNCPSDITVSANIPAVHPDECRAAFFLPEIGISDNCSDGWTVEVDHPLGHIDGNGGYVEGFAIGNYVALYTVIDDCGNVATCEINIHVVDDIAPTVQCDEITQVAVSSDGKITVPADVFDDGTHDNCCLDYFEVRRMSGGPFAPSVTFTCADIPNSPIIVIMRAYDCYGNYNDCMVEVWVEDKLPPITVICPGPQRITCDYYWDVIEVPLSLCEEDDACETDVFTNAGFGEPLFFDNCNLTIVPTVNINLDVCGEGTITRTWQATDPSGNGPATCTQIIFVDHVSDWVVEFPENITVTCTDEVPDFGEPVITDETCELIAVSYEDQLFNSVPDACYKIKRTWKVINWCVVGDFVDEEHVEDPESELCLPFPACDLDGDGDCDDRTFRDSWSCGFYPDASNATDLFIPDTDDDTDPWDGFITYEQHIKVIDIVAPVVTCTDVFEVCIEDDGCNADFTVPAPDVQECSSEITITATSDLPNFDGNNFTAFSVPPGTYTVTFAVMDNCGNSNACQTTVVVEDCKKPTPLCDNGLVVEIDPPDPEVTVNAEAFDEGSWDNCTDASDLIFSYSSDVDSTDRTFYCVDIGQQNVQIWVTDLAGNQDFCETFIIIQDNLGVCDTTGNPLVVISGDINTEDNEGIADVDVELNGGMQMVTTQDDGQFSFDVPSGGDYTVTPMKDIEPMNGVTTFDLVLITKHILGVKMLNSPYKMIAADINKSKSITTFDLVKLRKLILFIDDDFTNNTSWRFVDGTYDFPDDTNPWVEPFPEVVSFNNVDALISADFIGIKIGDVNGSSDPLGFTNADDRNKVDNLVFETEDVKLEKGNTYTVSFTAKDFNVLGYQFTMNFDMAALEFVDVLPGIAQMENFGLRLLDEGAITTSWNENDAQVADGEVMFSLVFTAKEDGQLSDLLEVTSRYTTAEAYDKSGELLDVVIEFTGTVVSTFELYQNIPNPFERTTTIGFNLPEATSATLTITDATGRVVRIIEGDYDKGYNQITVDRKSLGGAGVLYYQLDTSTDTAIKTMILVD